MTLLGLYSIQPRSFSIFHHKKDPQRIVGSVRPAVYFDGWPLDVEVRAEAPSEMEDGQGTPPLKNERAVVMGHPLFAMAG